MINTTINDDFSVRNVPTPSMLDNNSLQINSPVLINDNNSINSSGSFNNNNLLTIAHITNPTPFTRFSSKSSSPSLPVTKDTISFASLNVRGINNPIKFDAILDDLFNKNLSIIAL